MNLFSRNHGNSIQPEAKEVAMAHRILDRVKSCENTHQTVSDELLWWALTMTGDAANMNMKEA